MRRREFIALIGGATAARSLVARAQQAEGMAHVGMLGPNPDVTLASIGYRAFSAELQKLGFTQGKNLQLDYRRTDQGMDRAVAAARELVAAKSNVIVAIGPEISLRAALAPNSGLPIVILALITIRSPAATSKPWRVRVGTLLECLPVNRNSR